MDKYARLLALGIYVCVLKCSIRFCGMKCGMFAANSHVLKCRCLDWL